MNRTRNAPLRTFIRENEPLNRTVVFLGTGLRRTRWTTKTCDAAEAIIQAAFLVRDLPVLVPENDNEPYDIVVEINGEFYRIQCKTGYSDIPGRIRFEPRSTRVKSTGYERDTYRGKAEFFAVYNPVLDTVYLVDVEEAPTTGMNIRWAETKNNQATRVNWHADYVLDAMLEGL